MKPVIGIAPELITENGKPGLFLDQRYWQAVEEAGGIPLILPPTRDEAILREQVARIDGLLLTGGDDIDPRYYGETAALPLTLSPDLRTDFEIPLLRESMARRKPVLGICLGMQLVNVALGGSLIQDIPQQVPGALNHRGIHDVTLAKETLLSSIAKGIEIVPVPSSHHQGVGQVGEGLLVSARSADGIVEAVEIPELPFFLAVQWHPERGLDRKENRRLFESFVRACTGV